jgi:WD40 repeat protein
MADPKTEAEIAAAKKLVNEKRAAERKTLAEKQVKPAADAAKNADAAKKAAAEKEAAAKKQAPAEQQAKKPQPKKPSLYAPFEQLAEFTNKQQLCGAKFSPCGNYVVAGGMVGVVYRWDAAKEFAPLPDLPGHGGWIQALSFGPSGTTFYSGDSWGRLSAWDAAAADTKPLWTVADAHGAWVRGLAVSPDGKLLATAGRDGLVRLWDPATGKKLADLADHKEDVYSVAFSPDGKTLASGDFMGKIKLWDVATRKATRELDGSQFSQLQRLQDVGGVRVLKFTADGKTLIAGGLQPTNGGTVQGYPTVALYDLAADAKSAGKPTKTFKLGETKDGFVEAIVVHPAGQLMIGISGIVGNGKLLFLRTNEDKPYAETTKLANVHDVSLHPDGRRFLVVVCNPNNSGNGAVKSKESMEYVSNWSPVRLLELPSAEPTA